MSIATRNEFVIKNIKGCIVISLAISAMTGQPWGPEVFLDKMITDIQLLILLAPPLMGLLLPVGISQFMAKNNRQRHKWDAGSCMGRFVRIVPANKVLLTLFWPMLFTVLYGLPMVGLLNLSGITEMAGWEYFFFKLLLTQCLIVPLSFLVCSVAVADTGLSLSPVPFSSEKRRN